MSKQNTHVNVRVKEKKGEPFEKMVKRFLKKVKKERSVIIIYAVLTPLQKIKSFHAAVQ
jgi:hypothetical protein